MFVMTFIFLLLHTCFLIEANYVESDFWKPEPFLLLMHTHLIPQRMGEIRESKTHYKGNFNDGYWHDMGRLIESFLFYWI
jgi:hypothetical protein